MQELLVDVVTPTAQVLSAKGRAVSVPTAEGEITVLPGHAHLLGTITYGVLKLSGPEAPEAWFLAEGFVEASAERVVVLAERADPLAALDAKRAHESLADAERRLSRIAADTAEYAIQEKRRRRAQARLLAISERDAQR